MDGWFVLVAPAGVAAGIVARMNKEVGEFLKGDEIRTRLAGFGLATSGAGTPQSTAEFIARAESGGRWRRSSIFSRSEAGSGLPNGAYSFGDPAHHRRTPACVYRKLDSAILVVKAAENGL